MTNIVATASLGLVPLQSNSFSISVSSNTFARIAAPAATLYSLTTLSQNSKNINGLRFFMTGGTVVPSWLKVGAAVTLAGKTSSGSGAISLTELGGVLVSNVDASGTYFDVAVKNHLFAATLTADVLQSATATLIIHAQKIIFSTPATNMVAVTVADGADYNGNVAWSQDLAAGVGYEVLAPTGSKISATDWFAKVASGTQTLIIRFL